VYQFYVDGLALEVLVPVETETDHLIPIRTTAFLEDTLILALVHVRVPSRDPQ